VIAGAGNLDVPDINIRVFAGFVLLRMVLLRWAARRFGIVQGLGLIKHESFSQY